MPIHIDPSDPLFAIGVASKLTGLSPKQLRLLEQKDVIVPSRSDRSRRLYTLDQLSLLKYVAYLIAVRRANAGGISVALELLSRLPDEERTRVMEESQAALGQVKEPDLESLGDAAVPHEPSGGDQ
jgi:DNA-binding transcriptional MerR regulator